MNTHPPATALVVGLLVCTLPAFAATYYVATDGDDTNPGTARSPVRTIGHRARGLRPGDALIVRPGIYDEILPDVIPSGTARQPITIRSEVRNGAVIKPNRGFQGQLWRGIGILGLADKSHIIFDGFVVDASNLAPAYLVYIGDVTHDVTFSHNEVRYGGDVDSASNSLGFVTGGFDAYNITISHNSIHDIGTGAASKQAWYSYGIYWHGNESVIEYNRIYNCSGHGIHMYSTVEGKVNGNVVRGNVIHDNGSRGILLAAGGAGNLAYNNVVYHNGYTQRAGGIVVGGYGASSRNNRVYHNTVYGNAAGGIEIGSMYQGPSGTVVRGNICYRNGNDTILRAHDTNTTVEHNLAGVDPLFVNAAGHDFHLRAGSPAIGLVVAISEVAFGLDGMPRPRGAACDAGAYEYRWRGPDRPSAWR